MAPLKRYSGVVVFVDGVHYAVDKDGHPDMSRPLRYDAGKGQYRHALADEPSHFDTYHENHVELEFEGEEPITVTESEASAVKTLLDELRGGAS